MKIISRLTDVEDVLLFLVEAADEFGSPRFPLVLGLLGQFAAALKKSEKLRPIPDINFMKAHLMIFIFELTIYLDEDE